MVENGRYCSSSSYSSSLCFCVLMQGRARLASFEVLRHHGRGREVVEWSFLANWLVVSIFEQSRDMKSLHYRLQQEASVVEGYWVDWDRTIVWVWYLEIWNVFLGCGRCNQGIRNEVCYFLLQWLQVSRVFILFLFSSCHSRYFRRWRGPIIGFELSIGKTYVGVMRINLSPFSMR